MTTSYRLFSYLSLLPMVNIEDRPMFVVRKEGEIRSNVMPFATFEDLREAMSLVQFANGVRPYILEWYNDVFVLTFKAKTTADCNSRVKGEDTIIIEEDRIAVTTRQLVDATETKLKKRFTTQKMLEYYVTPLMNEGYIDKQQSNLHGRDNIYYPVVDAETLIVEDKTNNDQEIARIKVTDFTLNPTEDYIKGKIEEITSCSFENIRIKEILDCNKNPISVEDLVGKYYTNGGSYFQYKVIKDNILKQTIHFLENNDQYTNETIQNDQGSNENQARNNDKILIDEGNTINDLGSRNVVETVDNIPKESWAAKTITPSELSTTCVYCNLSFRDIELVAHMDKCAAEAVAKYERKRSLDN